MDGRPDGLQEIDVLQDAHLDAKDVGHIGAVAGLHPFQKMEQLFEALGDRMIEALDFTSSVFDRDAGFRQGFQVDLFEEIGFPERVTGRDGFATEFETLLGQGVTHGEVLAPG